MKTKMILNRARQGLLLGASLALAAVVALPALEQTVFAGAQVASRSIKMSDSRVSATAASYLVTFTAQTGATSLSLAIDFCQDSPIIGAACNTTNGLSFSSPTVTASTLPAGWAFDTSTGSTIKLKGTATSLSASTAYNFTINNVNNPTGTSGSAGTAGSFYARIYTFPNNTYGTYTNAAAPGNYVDYGGFALSTVSLVTITATVQETLTFCVSSTTITGTCSGGLTAPTLTIGSGSPATLHTTGDAVQAFTQLSTNANGGVTVRMKATNACTNGGLSTSAPDIAGGCLSVPGLGASAVTFTGGTANWGMCVGPGAGVTAGNNYKDTGSGANCPATYNGAATYGMNGANVISTYGDPIYTTAGAVNAIASTLTFAAQSANTTPAGVYQGNEILVATGVF